MDTTIYNGVFPNTKDNLYNNFTPIHSDYNAEYLAIKESVALQAGTLLCREIVSGQATGKLIAAWAEPIWGANIVGILWQEVLATDADYATEFKKKLVYTPRTSEARAEFTVISGTLSSASVGDTVEVASGARWLAVDTVGNGATITKYISATRWECKFNFAQTEMA